MADESAAGREEARRARSGGVGAGVIAQLRALGPVRLAALGGVGAAVLALLGWLALRAGQPPMGLLYGDLEPRDAAAVVQALERARVPYRLAAGGAQVLVPEEQVPRLRLMLAREGLPQGGSLGGGAVGYEIFDRAESLTTTPFQQDMNRVRALEGELARTIRGLAGVRAARVHLVLPRREAFSRERGEARASVVLTMQGAQRLDREGVQAVLHLVATAVPGLRPQNVSVVDSRGALLARGGQALAGPQSAETQEEIRRAQELRLARAVEEMLERTLGPGRVRAEATVELDFDRVQTTEERFDPDNQVPRSQSSTSERSRSAEPPPTGVAGNLPDAAANAASGGNQESRQEDTTNYEIGRTTRQVLREGPVVRRLSVAVLVDGVWEPAAEPGGAPRFRERSAEELARLAALVRSAVGFDERRGDRVEVVSLRFADPPAAAPEDPGWIERLLTPSVIARLAESGLLALVALAAIVLVARPVAGRLALALAPPAADALASSAPPGPEGAGASPALPGPGAGAAGDATGAPPGAGAEAMVQIANVEGQMRASSLARVAELVGRHPDETLAVLRRWLSPEEGH
ncbi:flagellar basal-body MS-ring/collar protein FliF [Caldovatus aquaticus]|uniref:Flagellar M-ring protein n=1 Tax=Caldovatus aquaticus TaxID=2865671 RepID=A0ABS7F5D8_9PROT|nr:flagellar basal-body MS-ring/collar protein FliF [Caldovatus aquaticus]MBW8270709.1 flagellar M-ring protein FliF [Caldovatus aquaticus]